MSATINVPIAAAIGAIAAASMALAAVDLVPGGRRRRADGIAAVAVTMLDDGVPIPDCTFRRLMLNAGAEDISDRTAARRFLLGRPGQ